MAEQAEQRAIGLRGCLVEHGLAGKRPVRADDRQAAVAHGQPSEAVGRAGVLDEEAVGNRDRNPPSSNVAVRHDLAVVGFQGRVAPGEIRVLFELCEKIAVTYPDVRSE